MYIYMYIHIHVYVCTYTCTYIYMYMYVHVLAHSVQVGTELLLCITTNSEDFQRFFPTHTNLFIICYYTVNYPQ